MIKTEFLNDGTLIKHMLNYPLITYSMKAIQELSAEVENLKKEIKKLKEAVKYGDGRLEKRI